VAKDSRVRVDVAFDGGASLSVLVSVNAADDLERALASGNRESLSFEADDGNYTVVVGKILYARRTEREQIVGFGPSE
jgi:hypothetical protein